MQPNQPQMQPKLRLVLPGTMGEAPVLKALFGPQSHVGEMELDGFALYKQPLPPAPLWNIMKEFWDDAGHPYKGAYTLIPQEGAKTTVGYVDFDSVHDMKKAAKLLNFWDAHAENPNDPKEREEAWFRYHAFQRDGIMYVTDMINGDPTDLEPVEEGYRETEEYQQFVKDMAIGANEYRISVEGPPRGIEK